VRDLIIRPGAYFGEFTREQSSWAVALLGYYLISLPQTYENVLAQGVGSDSLTSLLRAVLVNIAAIPLGFLFWGIIWFGIGTKVLNPRSSLMLVAKAMGYAFLVPGVPGVVLLIPFLALASGTESMAGGVLLGYVGVALGFAFLALARCWKVVRQVGDLGRIKTVVVFVWLPALLLGWIAFDELVLRRS
jgi:hypothetical protein